MQEPATVTNNLTLIDLLSVVSRDEDERQRLWDLKFRQRAAELALEKENSYDKATLIILRDISRDPNNHENIRHPCKAWEAIAYGRQEAEESLAEESTEHFSVNAYFKPNAWKYCVEQLKLEFTVTIDGFEDKLQHYVGHANLNVTGDPDAFTTEIARLNSVGFTAQLLENLHLEYAEDCERMRLPKDANKPKAKSKKSKRGCRKSIKLSNQEGIALGLLRHGFNRTQIMAKMGIKKSWLATLLKNAQSKDKAINEQFNGGRSTNLQQAYSINENDILAPK